MFNSKARLQCVLGFSLLQSKVRTDTMLDKLILFKARVLVGTYALFLRCDAKHGQHIHMCMRHVAHL